MNDPAQRPRFYRRGHMPRHNETFFGFGMTPVEAEGLYRSLNRTIGEMEQDDDPNLEATVKFREEALT